MYVCLIKGCLFLYSGELFTLFCCFQSQCWHCSCTGKGQAGTGGLSGQYEKGTDEGGLAWAHARAKGELYYSCRRPMLGRNVKYVNLCYRTKRLRSWLRSVMSWSLKWGRVSDCAAPRSDLGVRNTSFALPKDWWALKIRMVPVTFPADFVYRGATGMVSPSWLCIFFWCVIQCILLKTFQYHIINECVWVCVCRKEHC